MLAADRDAMAAQADQLARQLEMARSEITTLRGQVERLSLPPTTLEGLSERLQRMLRLAQEEASETKARADAEAGHIRAKAEEDARLLRARYDALLRDLDRRRAEMEAEHRAVLEKARDDAEALLRRAEDDRIRADAEAEQRRNQVEEDFEIAMAARRTKAMRILAEQEVTSKAEAERRVREATEEATQRRQDAIAEATARLRDATEEAHRRVREATEEANRRISHAGQRVVALRELRTKLSTQLYAARDLLADAHESLEKAAPALDPLPPEQSPALAGTPKPAEGNGRPPGDEPTKVFKPVAEVTGPPKEDWEPDDADMSASSGGPTAVRPPADQPTRPVAKPANRPANRPPAQRAARR